MSLVKVSEATNAQLDWMVAKCESQLDTVSASDKHYWRAVFSHWDDYSESCAYSTEWEKGGPIIERERISTQFWVSEDSWEASIKGGFFASYGPTPLIAAMRCYVISKLGNSVEVSN